MSDRGFWLAPILIGLALGVALGLTYTWGIAPVQYYDTAPDRLRADLKAEYILLIGEAYRSDGDWPAAQERLAQLNDPDIPDTLLEMTEGAIAAGKPLPAVRAVAELANRLGASSPAIAAFAPSGLAPASPPPAAVAVTFTPPPATPSPSPTPTMPAPTMTPLPTPTRQVAFRLLAQQLICDPDRPGPVLEIIVRDADGEPLGGVEVMVIWEQGMDRLVTGLKPELGRGYADFALEVERVYVVELAAGSDRAEEIQTAGCTSSQGPRWLSTRLIFEKLPGD